VQILACLELIASGLTRHPVHPKTASVVVGALDLDRLCHIKEIDAHSIIFRI
jgi:hypothetical protein